MVSTVLNTLLAWPDHPYGFGTLYGSEFNPETKCRESFVIAETVDLDRSRIYAKEQALIEEVKAQLVRGRKCQVFAVYTNKHDVIERLEGLLRKEGIRAGVLRASVPTHKREAWYGLFQSHRSTASCIWRLRASCFGAPASLGSLAAIEPQCPGGPDLIPGSPLVIQLKTFGAGLQVGHHEQRRSA